MNERGRRNIWTGRVISDKMDKSCSVLIYRSVKHPKYKKYIKKTSVFKAHDENNRAKIGDIVRIFETRALSKNKRWKLIDRVQFAGESGSDRDVDIVGYGSNKGKQKTGNQQDHRVDSMEGNFSDAEIRKIKRSQPVQREET